MTNGPREHERTISTKSGPFPMTLQNDVLNPGPVLNQHPRKAWKSMTSRGGRPCCGGYPCRPPKMHQIGNEVVRDWSLWGSWYFCLFWWFLEIVSGFFWQEVRSFSWVLLSERCFVILLYIYIFNIITLYIPNLPIPQTQNQDTRAAPAWGTVWSSAGFSEAGCQT